MSCMCHQQDDLTSVEDQLGALGRDIAPPYSPAADIRQQSKDAAAKTLDRDQLWHNEERTLTFRVTGAASVARLKPLLLNGDRGNRTDPVWSQALTSDKSGGGIRPARLDFVWETTVSKEQLEQHRSARVLNRLSGAQVLEDKANLALLQRMMKAPTLDSHVVNGRKAVALWAKSRFDEPPHRQDAPLMQLPPHEAVVKHELKSSKYEHNDTRLSKTTAITVTTGEDGASNATVGDNVAGGEDWWCVKAAGGNGGLDIWIVHRGNWKSVTHALNDNDTYVIQRYVERPMLWRGRKFHFRAYALIRADMSAWLYRTSYILSASRPYSLERNDHSRVDAPAQDEVDGIPGAGLVDGLVHISNLAVNKHTEGHPGQVPCDLPSEYPALWPRMLDLLRSLVEAAAPFMQHQANPNHFEFLGLDIIADNAGVVWLMEANRLPGLQSSKQNLEEENQVYDRMMLDILRLLVLPPLTGSPPEHGRFEAAATRDPKAVAPSTETWRNVMRFAAYKRSCRTKVPLP